MSAMGEAGDRSGRIMTVLARIREAWAKPRLPSNLAIGLVGMVKKPVALVDFNLQLGDITTFLDIIPKQTIVDIAKNMGGWTWPT